MEVKPVLRRRPVAPGRLDFNIVRLGKVEFSDRVDGGFAGKLVGY